MSTERNASTSMSDLRNRPPGYSLLRKLHQLQASTPEPSIWGALLADQKAKPVNQSWQVGYEGEVAVGEILEALRHLGYIVLHSVPIGSRGADVDHLVISPTGLVFVINTKHHPGKVVEYARESLRASGLKQDHLTNSLDEAARVRQRLCRIGIPARDVQPLLTFVNVREPRLRGRSRVPLLLASELVEHVTAAEKERASTTAFTLSERVYTETFWIGRTTVDDVDYVAFGRQLSKKVQNQDLKHAILTILGESVTYLVAHPEVRAQIVSYAPSFAAVAKGTRTVRVGVVRGAGGVSDATRVAGRGVAQGAQAAGNASRSVGAKAQSLIRKKSNVQADQDQSNSVSEEAL